MSLTTNEKKILGMMVDDGILKKARRENVGADDAVARQEIAAYVPKAIVAKQKQKSIYETALADYGVALAEIETHLALLED